MLEIALKRPGYYADGREFLIFDFLERGGTFLILSF